MRAKRATELGNYASNKELMEEFVKSKEAGRMTDRLGTLVMLIANRFARQSSWAQYSFREDMVAFAVMNLVAQWSKFDPTKGSNLFSYYTTGVYRSFLYYIAKEKDLANVRNTMRLDMGYQPTWNYENSAHNSDTHSFMSVSTADE